MLVLSDFYACEVSIIMKKILITGATDGIGLATAKVLASQGHHLLVHGRNPARLDTLEKTLFGVAGAGLVECYQADLSRLDEVEALAQAVSGKHDALDVLINNAGVLKTPDPITPEGWDVRFVVNTFAPYLLTRRLLPLLGEGARIINVSSAAQNPVDRDALMGKVYDSRPLEAYAQSKLALNQWSRRMALELGRGGPVVVCVNPGSKLTTKMVRQGFGVDGHDVMQGANILVQAALSGEFEDATGKYYDNDAGRFAPPHADALDDQKCRQLVETMETLLFSMGISAGVMHIDPTDQPPLF